MKKIYTAKRRPRHLGIVSDAHHYRDDAGKLYVLTPVARQFEQWAALFPRVTVCAPLLPGTPPSTHTPYAADNIHLVPISAAGGDSVRAKLHMLAQTFRWARALNRLFNRVDAVHIRCPNNISIPGLLLLHLRRLPREAVYTGSWYRSDNKSFFFRWQRNWLRERFNGPVAVYGERAGEPKNIVSSFSPSYSDDDWQAETDSVQRKLEKLKHLRELPRPLRLVSVGSLNANKNQQLILHAVKRLTNSGVDVRLHLLGDGDKRDEWKQLSSELEISDRVFFNGHTAALQVRQFYRDSDFVIQSPRLEGYGKVPIEAFFYGCIPILSDVDLTRDILGAHENNPGERGRFFALEDVEALVACIMELSGDTQEMARLIKNGRAYAREHTLEAWREHLREMLTQHWKVQI
jgi:glycosyltransferase involved in cell wall biosynthesis